VFEIPLPLGRGVIVGPGAPAPPAWSGAARVVVDDATLREPADTVDVLHGHWSTREPVVVELQCEAEELRAPEAHHGPAFTVDARFEFARERLYFLTRANNYDARSGEPRWGPTIEAERAGAAPSEIADVQLPDGTAAWCDGGPRGNPPPGLTIVHRNNIEQHTPTPDRAAETRAALADDQLEAVLHDGGPARVVAPAGSGKTRVLTERLRLLHGRRWSHRSITALAYNVRAKDTMRARLADLPAEALDRIRTLHALGNDILRRGQGNANLIDEWDMRRRIDALVPVKPRANTDVFAPYLEALSEVRLGLVDPAIVEARRDDVPGFSAMFDEYRDKLRADGAIDHDEQIYGAVEVLLRDGKVRRAMQRACRHLLVDEFQDLTPAQLLMLRLVAAPAYDVFGVGDDDQVIYGYAGADPEFLINYARYFPGGAQHALHTNYRCPAPVVAGSRNLLSYNRRRIDKEIVAAKTDGALSTAAVPAERLALAAVEQATMWFEAGAVPGGVAVLARVNSSLLPVQLLFGEANVPCWTPVSTAVLNRTGTRTALAYLRCAVATRTGQPCRGTDVATAARRPSRSVRREMLQRVERRRQWRIPQLRDLASQMTGTAADKFDAFCDDLESLGRAFDNGATTAELLTRVRDDVGLGNALTTLDVSGKHPDGSHRDDLNALIAVATFEPEPVAFEPWLHSRLRAPDERPSSEGVAISTVHRVKGMEWPYVIVLGAHEGLMPHALADDLEEERRIFHVAITRGDTAVHVLHDAAVPAPFVDQLARPAPAGYTEPARVTRAVMSDAPVGDAPTALVTALKAWRKQRAASDRVPAYVVLSDAHLTGIAARAPASLEELARCAGIGPTKLERYGDEIVAVIADLGTS
jgi:DNA helicase II / ATP-dependent DNA helicase PcrA